MEENNMSSNPGSRRGSLDADDGMDGVGAPVAPVASVVRLVVVPGETTDSSAGDHDPHAVAEGGRETFQPIALDGVLSDETMNQRLTQVRTWLDTFPDTLGVNPEANNYRQFRRIFDENYVISAEHPDSPAKQKFDALMAQIELSKTNAPKFACVFGKGRSGATQRMYLELESILKGTRPMVSNDPTRLHEGDSAP
jgi:hypothetical protein